MLVCEAAGRPEGQQRSALANRPDHRDGEGKLDVGLQGSLTGILSLAAKKNRKDAQAGDIAQQVKVVAGVGFEPTTFRL